MSPCGGGRLRPAALAGATRLGAGTGLVALVLIGAASGCATSGGSGGGAASWEGKLAPDITVKTMKGTALPLASLRGKVVLLDVWATWCAPCKQELPMLDDMAGRLKSKGVEIVAVSVDVERDNVEKFLADRPAWKLTVAHDPDQAVARTLDPNTMPSSYVIDKEGVIRRENRGFEPSDAPRIERQLEELTQ